MSKVFLALQAVEDVKAIVRAIEEDNSNVIIEQQPAMIKITAIS